MAATRARSTRVLARGGKLLGWVAASLPLPAPAPRLPREPVLLRRPGPGGGGREERRASDSSSPTPFSRALQVSGLSTWALWEGARRQHLGNPSSAQGQPSAPAYLRSWQKEGCGPAVSSQLPGVAWRGPRAGQAARLLPERGASGRVRVNSARLRLPAPRVAQQMHSTPTAEKRLFISRQAARSWGILGLVVSARVERKRI